MIEEVSIFSGSREYKGWDSFRFEHSIDEAASSFSFQTSKNPLNLSEPSISDDIVQIKTNGDLLLTGYIDRFELDADANAGRVLNLSGRSKTGDLVDSSVMLRSFSNVSVSQIVKQLTKDFDIEVVFDGDFVDETHVSYTPEAGKSVIGAIQDVVQLQQQKISCSPEGKLVIWRETGKTSNSSVSSGQPIKRFRVSIDKTVQFSEIISLAQDTAQFEKLQASEIGSKTKIKSFSRRYRPRVIFPDADSTSSRVRENSSRTARRSLGASSRLEIDLVGWRSEDGLIYSAGQKMAVEIPEINLSQVLMIKSVSLSQSLDSGTTSTLLLEPLSAHVENGTSLQSTRSIKSQAVLPSRSETPQSQETPEPSSFNSIFEDLPSESI